MSYLEKLKNAHPNTVSTYCKWYFDDCLDWDKDRVCTKWSVISSCKDDDDKRFTREVSRTASFYKQLYSKSPCPGCNRPMTVGRSE